jgi:hypothetical protein
MHLIHSYDAKHAMPTPDAFAICTPHLQAAVRLVRCEAWSAMATLLRVTQSNPKFYKTAMFARHE